MTVPSTPHVDLVVVFRASPATRIFLSKHAAREDAAAAEAEYTRLLATLRNAGLMAAGRRGQKNGQILILVHAPMDKLAKLAKMERYVFVIEHVIYKLPCLFSQRIYLRLGFNLFSFIQILGFPAWPVHLRVRHTRHCTRSYSTLPCRPTPSHLRIRDLYAS